MVKMSAQQDLSPDSSFSSKAFTINPMDIVKYLLYNWYWFVLSVAIFGGIQWYRYSTTQNVYSCSAQVMFKDALQNMAGLDRFSRYNQKFNVSNEILQFQSSAFMSEAVKRLNADIDYTVMDYLRVKELYNQSPVQVEFIDAEPASVLNVTVTPQDGSSVMLSDFPVASKNLIAKLNTVVKTPIGRLKVIPTPYYTEQYYKKGIDVQKNSRGHVTSALLKNLRIYQAETSDASNNSSSSSILNMTLKDNNVERAKDVLNMLITIYNEENIKDKNKVAVNTANFINERLEIISKELSGVEQDLQSYKEANQMVDVGSEASYSLSNREEYTEASKDLRMQAQMGNYIKEYLADPSKQNDLIPTNTGIKDGNVESQINQFNATKMKRDRLVEGSSEKNPVVQDLDKSLASMRQSIMRSVDNLNVSNNVRLRDVQSRAGEARAKVSAIPRKQRQMLSIERQQNIKQELYLYLLNKREENALAQATTESNARVINPAMGSETPIAPNEKSMITKGVLAGLAVPAIILLFF
ncbi:MAG: chromosome partitioning protein ParA, partial [Prevotella sp.]|nr:chromosome partitioning protein ParA [Prevotella sp.]